MDLRGQIEVAVVGRIDSKHGGIRATFTKIPDAPQCAAKYSESFCRKLLKSLKVTMIKPSASESSSKAVSTKAKTASNDFVSLRKKSGSKVGFSGQMQRGGHPTFKAVLTTNEGSDSKNPEANISKVQVALPHSAFLDQAHIKTICTRVQFAAGGGNGEQCPAGAVYGHAKVWTPLLDYALEGNVFLRSSDHPLPDLVLALKGPSYQPLAITLDGRVDSKNGGIRTTFENTPDAPATKVILEMAGGSKGLIVNSTNLCASVNKATVKMDAQNGKTFDFRTPVQPECPKSKKGKGKKGKKHKGANFDAIPQFAPSAF
jgi:hypothetical protein